MGLRRAFAALLSLGGVAATGGDALPLREANWIAASAEVRLEQLTSHASYCSNPANDSGYGAVAFQDPLLLGGQAARAGISCASCHRGGRGSLTFSFPGVSDTPGTADVSSSIFSSHRGDGLFNPKPIPNLTFDPPKISRTEPGRLESFIRGLIVEEFDGPEPPARVVAGLAAFVRSLDPKACNRVERLNVETDLGAYAQAIWSGQQAIAKDDRETAVIMLRAARSRLGLIAERYPDDPTLQTLLGDASIALAKHQLDLSAGLPAEPIDKALNDRLLNIDIWAIPLRNRSANSLYNPDRLAAALNAARTP